MFVGLVLPLTAYASIEVNLKYGSTGQKVVELQEFLIEKGFLKSEPTGNFYSLTRKAVKEYQKSEGIPSTGFVGPITREKINAELEEMVSESNNQEEKETGTVTEPIGATVGQSVANNQLELLQQQIKAQETLNQQTLQKLQEVTNNTQRIVENTTPIVSSAVEVKNDMKPEPIKDLQVTYKLTNDEETKYQYPQSYSFNITYTEDGNVPDKWFVSYYMDNDPQLKFYGNHEVLCTTKKEDCAARPGFDAYTPGTYTFHFSVGTVKKDIVLELGELKKND